MDYVWKKWNQDRVRIEPEQSWKCTVITIKVMGSYNTKERHGFTLEQINRKCLVILHCVKTCASLKLEENSNRLEENSNGPGGWSWQRWWGQDWI
jgi:hypothetical protein